MISGQHAAMARRLLTLAAALIATLGAHALTDDELRPVPAAPLIWGSVAALVVLT
ncbi:MAG: hypothetical protein JHC74_03710, partial [Thermoleophilia bacterium]|nr:hypothetical protein [Thermoleophilia bacterium]